MSATNKALVRRMFEEVWNQGNLALIDEIVASHWTDHDTGSEEESSEGPTGFKQGVLRYREAFPDLAFTIEEQMAEGDQVVTRWRASGTQTGTLEQISPTGKQATVRGISMDRCVGGQIVESWIIFDQLDLLHQLGVVPKPSGR